MRPRPGSADSPTMSPPTPHEASGGDSATKSALIDAVGHVTIGLLAGTDRTGSFDLIAQQARELFGGPRMCTARLADVATAADSDPRVGSIEAGALRNGPGNEAMIAIVELPHGASALLTVTTLPTAPAFRDGAAVLLASFAGQVSFALELVETNAVRQRIVMADDHERIARDLHDLVIQRLFGVGMTLQAFTGRLEHLDDRRRVDGAVDEIDLAIKELRTAIFALTPTDSGGLRAALLGVVAEHGRRPGLSPSITFDGPVDYLDATIVDHASATVTEALSNAVRHAQAKRVEVRVRADGRTLVIAIVDDGDGIADEHRHGNGLSNMTARANQLGGNCRISRNPERGSTLEWKIPIIQSVLSPQALSAPL